MKIALAQINPVVFDLENNTKKILFFIKKAKESKHDLIIFPELALTGYPPEDLLFRKYDYQPFLNCIGAASDTIGILLGAPRHRHNSVYFFTEGKQAFVYDKKLLPTYDIFDEARYFVPGNSSPIFSFKGKKLAVTICEDLWAEEMHYTHDPINSIKNVDLLINIAASPFTHTKWEKRVCVAKRAAIKTASPLVMCNQVGANDSILFDGKSFFMNTNGELISVAKTFEEDMLSSTDTDVVILEKREELWKGIVTGIRDFFSKQSIKKAILGISGGIDSALVATLAVDALQKENVFALFMPSRFTKKTSEEDALSLIKNLDIPYHVIPIDPLFTHYCNTLYPFFGHHTFSTVEENIQARIRCNLLMAFANKDQRIALSTSNKIEMAFGYTTLYGDLGGGLAPIADLKKGEIYDLAKHKKNLIPSRIFIKPPSAELYENQKDSDILPDYDIADSLIHAYIEEGKSLQEIQKILDQPPSKIREWLSHIDHNEFKRKQAPLGLKVSEKSFFKGRTLPIVHNTSFS